MLHGGRHSILESVNLFLTNPLFYLVEYGNFDFLFTDFLALSS